MRRTLLFLLLIVLAGTGGNCGSTEDTPTGPVRVTGITLDPSDLWPLVSGQGFYEIWLGTPAVTPEPNEDPWELEQVWEPGASFRVDGEGKVRDLQDRVAERFPLPRDYDASGIARAVLTYQPSSDVGGPHSMGMWLAVGDFVAPGGTISTTLSWDDPEVFDKDLRAVQGNCRLRAETGEDGPTVPNGIWFYTPADVEQQLPAAPSLELGSALPEGWVYEAWAFQRSLSSLTPLQIFPLGRFLQASGQDSDGAGPYAAAGPFAPYPGQDFVRDTVIDFSDGSWSTMITLEPISDPMPQVPTSLRVLERKINIGDGVDVPLALVNRAQEERLPLVLLKIVR